MADKEKTSLTLPSIFLFGDNEAASDPTPEVYQPSPIIHVAEDFVSAIINAGACVADCVEGVAEMFLAPEPEEDADTVIVRPI